MSQKNLYPKVEIISRMNLFGFSTKIDQESNPNNMSIEQLRQRFFEVSKDYSGLIFGVFSKTNKDQPTFSMASENSDIFSDQSISISAGKYLIFNVKDEQDTKKIEQFFTQFPEIKRRNETDFELYSSQKLIAIYISIE